MKNAAFLFVIIVFLLGNSAFAFPDLQLFVDGATYDAETESWVTSGSSFNLYVIGAKRNYTDVHVSMALMADKGDDPNGSASIDVDGNTYDSWTYGYAPMISAPTWDNSDDLARHGIFPAWFAEFHAGDFGEVGGVGDVQPQPDYWNPATEGYLPNSRTLGEIKMFTINLNTAGLHVHFDAFTLDEDGGLEYFAPFSHDVTAVPEPGTMLLLGLGIAGIAIRRRFTK